MFDPKKSVVILAVMRSGSTPVCRLIGKYLKEFYGYTYVGEVFSPFGISVGSDLSQSEPIVQSKRPKLSEKEYVLEVRRRFHLLKKVRLHIALNIFHTC